MSGYRVTDQPDGNRTVTLGKGAPMHVYRVTVKPQGSGQVTVTVESDVPLRQGQATTHAMLGTTRGDFPAGSFLEFDIEILSGAFAPYPGRPVDFVHPGVTVIG